VLGTDKPGVHHCSFEVEDLDAVMAGHDYLRARGYTHDCGVGRHLLGSQIFDYWRDPFGYVHEHWADTDRLDASAPAHRWDVAEGMVTQWGEPTPQAMREATKP
jgi:hypothetical protein